MTDIKTAADRLLESYGMVLGQEELNRIVLRFIGEMERGLTPEGSSLSMLPSYLGAEKPIPVNEPVIVIDAGGTNLRVCSVVFDSSGGHRIANRSRMTMPGVREEISAEAFYRSICDSIEPLLHLSDRIGFCFSYPVEITDRKDGKLLFWTKEIKAPEVVSTYIGGEMNRSLRKRGIAKKRIVILNDTVATLLAGRAKGQQRQCESYIGFILGTGTNTAYIEQNAKIDKIRLNRGSQIINVESGGFTALQQGRVDRQFDLSTEKPGTCTFEKMISGVYLGPLVQEMVKVAIEDGTFSFTSSEMSDRLPSFETKAVSRFLENPHLPRNGLGRCAKNRSDLELLYRLVQGAVHRAGQLTAVNMVAAMLKSGKGRNPLYPICINIDGSTYHNLFGFQYVVNRALYDLALERGLHYYLVNVDQSPVIGAAIAGLVA